MQLTLFHFLCFVLLNLSVVLIGYVFLKNKLIWPAWLLFVISIIIIHFIFITESSVIRMLVIIATTFTGMKVIAAAEAYKGKEAGLKFNQWIFFAIGWAGMRPQPFETLGSNPLPNAWPLINFGISRVVVGLLLITLAHMIVRLPLHPNIVYTLVSTILLVGFSLILHFGLLSISAGMWRLHGVDAYSLFREPAKATSLTELWAKRWNIAFSEMTSVAVFRPLKDRVGNGWALILSFAFSGLLHELALSVPVNSGYGLPLLYFIIQGLLVLLEKALINLGFKLLQHKTIGWVWTFFWIIIPMPLLFHTQFIKEILWPLAGFQP